MRALLATVLLVGCGAGETTTSVFVTDGTGDDFYALPFPNDVWRKPDGTLDLSQFPTNALLVDTYRVAAESLDGFGLNQAVYTRYEGGALDPKSVPDPATSVSPTSSVYLVDVDPNSPARGERIPIAAAFHAEPTATIGPDHLVARPYPGFGLLEGTTYALVVTNRLHNTDGNAVVPAKAFADLLADKGDARVAAAYAPLFAWLDEPGDDDRADVVSATVFTTQHATSIVPAIRKAVFGAPAPLATGITSSDANTFKLFEGSYLAPNLQTGEPPYRNAPDGEIRVGADGAAVISRMETMRFAITVPKGAVPAGGFPLAIYSHGTGGDYKSFVEDGTGNFLALQGIATISTDQVLHGPRNPGGNPELDFFNFSNPYAMRDNVLQGAADAWSQLRLADGLSIKDGARTIKLDTTQVFFFGHSQGGITGPGFVAFEPSVSAAVFSGTGGVLYLALLHKTAPLNIPDLVGTLVRDDPLDEDNPTLAMFQMWAERSDGANYAPLMVRRPPLADDGTPIPPHNIFQTEGFTDTFTPNPSIEAFATALGGDLVQEPDAKPVEGLELRERAVMPTPIMGNLDGVTVVLAQYKQVASSDGHFVVFEVPNARKQSSEFLGTLARTGTATVITTN